MKRVEYQGKEYEVEDWVNYIATDADGSIWAWEDEVYIGLDNHPYEWIAKTDDNLRMQNLGKCEKWKDSLMILPD